MKPTPRPAARVLLAGRFAVARSALLARPDGPVNGLDLSRGVPVVLELLSAAEGAALAAAGDEVRRHRGGWVRAGEPPPAGVGVPVHEAAPACPRAPRIGSLRRELATRRMRITGLAAAGIACALVVAGLLGGARPGGAATARAASPPALRPAAPVLPAVAPHPLARARVRVVPASHPGARGGAARVLVAAPAAHPRRPAPPARPAAPTRTVRTVVHAKAPVHSTGWVASLFVGR